MGSPHELLVVGAGPAGMAAGWRAAQNGLRVCVVDDNPAAGGQIWPPAAGSSSTTHTRKPFCAARHPAAMPAGPAPTTSSSCGLPIGSHVHPVSTNRLTTTTMLLAVDRHAALKTDPHAT